jgi:hypothetical protein
MMSIFISQRFVRRPLPIRETNDDIKILSLLFPWNRQSIFKGKACKPRFPTLLEASWIRNSSRPLVRLQYPKLNASESRPGFPRHFVTQLWADILCSSMAESCSIRLTPRSWVPLWTRHKLNCLGAFLHWRIDTELGFLNLIHNQFPYGKI